MNKLLIMKILAAMFAPISCIPFGEEKCFLLDFNQRPFVFHPLALLLLEQAFAHKQQYMYLLDVWS